MPLYEDRTNAENKIKVNPGTSNSVVAGNKKVSDKILQIIKEKKALSGKAPKIAIDAWYGVDWDAIIDLFKKAASGDGMNFHYESFARIFKEKEEIASYKKTFITDDPAFGWSNTEGSIVDIIDTKKLDLLKERISKDKSADAIIIYGYGSSISELKDVSDIRFYADMTQQQLLWKMWDGQLIPFGREEVDKEYFWKEYYYCDFYLLHHHKPFAFSNMDYYLDVTDVDQVKMMPKPAFDDIVATMAKYPVKEVKDISTWPLGRFPSQRSLSCGRIGN